MRCRLLFLGLISAGCALGGYSYEFAYPTSPYLYTWYETAASWSANGSTPYFPLYADSVGFPSAASFVWVPTISSGTNPNDYEVNTTLTLAAGGGTYIHYLRASSGALASSGSGTGSYVSVEIAVPSAYTSGAAAAELTVHQCSSGSVTTLGSQSISVLNGATLRTVVWGTTLWVFLDNQLAWTGTVSSSTGQPGFGGYGMTSPSGFIQVLIGHRDTVAPNSPSSTGLRSSILPTQASLEWQGATDDSNGIGVAGYNVSRNGTALGFYPGAELGDSTVSAGTSYTYAVAAVDFHGNVGTATSWTITTPPATAVDPRRVGLYTTGSYWGGGGEQIDTLSGNLNFSLPLVSAQGRTGWSVSAGLNYNSQNWRQDSGTNWELGADVGFGYGWKAQIGSITPYYLAWPGGVDHYVFTDGTGAEYRLDQNTGNIWSSLQGIYVWFDANANTLHFKDGTFWLMGDVSSGAEQDAGTLYPTVLEDVSGNQVIVTYKAALSVPGSASNTSARISAIQGVQSGGYTFTYNTDAIPHLTGVTQSGTSNSFSLTYASGVTLGPPFGTDSSYSGTTTTHLASVTPAAVGNAYEFTYDSAGAGELTEAVFPWGGHLRWAYETANYAGSRSIREVFTRYLAADSAGATEWTYPITHSDYGTTIAVVHADTTLADSSGTGAKQWKFNSSASTWSSNGPWQIGLVSEFIQKSSASATTAMTDDTYIWSPSSGNGTTIPYANPYIASKVSVLDGVISSKTTQMLDAYGNLTDMQLFPYYTTTVPTTPVKKYDNTYLTGSSYISNYIRNRLVSTAVTPAGGSAITLLTNTYDIGGTYTCSTSYPCPTAQFDTTPPIPLAYRGLVVTSVTPTKTTTNTYYGYGALYTSTGTDGSTLTNSVSSTTNYAAPDTITTQSYSNALAYDSWLGVTQTTGLNGEQMFMTYDAYGRPASATSPYWTTYGIPTVTYGYSGSGTEPAWQSKTGPDGYTKTTLDGLGRSIKVERGPNASTIQGETDTVYAPCACSPLAKIQKTSQPYASGGTPVWTTYTYDGIGRTLTVQQPDGASTTTYAYSGDQTTVTDPAGKWKQFTSDVEGNLITVVEPDPSSGTGGTLTTSYTYDWMNHLTTSTMTRGSTTQTRTFVYDSAGRLTSATNPESGTTSYTYNSDNTLAHKIDAKSQAVVYSYDTSKRVTETQQYPSGLSGAEDTCARVTYGWDTNTLDWTSFSSNTTGRLATVQYSDCLTNELSDPEVVSTIYTEMYSYHPAGGVTAKRFQIVQNLYSDDEGYETSGVNMDVDYTYDSAGRVNSTTVPYFQDGSGYAQPTVTYSIGYDSMGRPNSMRDNNAWMAANGYSTQWVQDVAYDYAGRRTSLQRYLTSDGLGDDEFTTETTGYNVNGQMTSVGWSSAWGGVNGSITYSYSSTQNNGQITQAADTVSGETIVYAYDALKQLTSAAATPNSGSTPTAWTQTYQYDGFGNLTAKVLGGTTTAIGVTAATNRLSSSGYDANGNMLTGVGATFTYDESNRMVSATPTSGGTEHYGYAPDNGRIHKINGYGDEVFTLYGARGEKVGIYAMNWGNYTPTEIDVWFAGKLIWQSPGLSATAWTVYEDRVGTNRQGGARFRPYGDEITSTANDRTKFATYTRDAFTALDYAQNRYYASAYGRFTSVDPDRKSANPRRPTSWNRYVYASDDPVNRNDPSGKMDCWTYYQDVVNSGFDPDDGAMGNCQGLEGATWASLDPCSVDPEFLNELDIPVSCDAGDDGGGGDTGSGDTTDTTAGTSSPDPLSPGGSIFDALSNDCTTGSLSGVFGVQCGTAWLLAPTPSVASLSQLLSALSGLLGNALGAVVIGILNPSQAGGSDEVCWQQYQADLIICRQLGSPGCYDQAAQRYASCLQGKAPPPFPYSPPPVRRTLPPSRPRRPNGPTPKADGSQLF